MRRLSTTIFSRGKVKLRMSENEQKRGLGFFFFGLIYGQHKQANAHTVRVKWCESKPNRYAAVLFLVFIFVIENKMAI